MGLEREEERRNSSPGGAGLSDRVCSPLLRDTANAQLAEPLQKGGPPHVPPTHTSLSG